MPARLPVQLIAVLAIGLLIYSATASAQLPSGGATLDRSTMAYSLGRFNDPPKPDQIFKIPYKVTNGTADIDNDQSTATFTILIDSIEDGLVEVKYPRNYPYTDVAQLDGVDGRDAIVFVNEIEEFPEMEVTDCFYEFSIPFSGDTKIDVVWPFLGAMIPRHGDDVPASCIEETIVDNVPTRADGTISPLHQVRAGIAADDVVCKEQQTLVIHSSGRPYCVSISNAEVLQERWNL